MAFTVGGVVNIMENKLCKRKKKRKEILLFKAFSNIQAVTLISGTTPVQIIT